MLPELIAAQGLLKYLHHHIKTELEGLDETGLNWVPEGVEATNSLYGLTLHIATTQVAFAGALAHQKLRLDIPGLEEVEDSLPGAGNIGGAGQNHLAASGGTDQRCF